jgi:hypothetical protein
VENNEEVRATITQRKNFTQIAFLRRPMTLTATTRFLLLYPHQLVHIIAVENQCRQLKKRFRSPPHKAAAALSHLIK